MEKFKIYGIILIKDNIFVNVNKLYDLSLSV